MFFRALGLERAREYSVPFAEVYVQKRNLFRALSPDPFKYPIYSDFHHTHHASILWSGVANHWLCFRRRYAFSCLRLLHHLTHLTHCAPHPPLLVPPETRPAGLRPKWAPPEPTGLGRVLEGWYAYIKLIILDNTVLVCSLDLYLNPLW